MRLPPGRCELEALELNEPTGLQATNGHQNAENPAPTTQFSIPPCHSGRSSCSRAGGRRLRTVAIGGWRGVGAAVRSRPAGAAGGSCGCASPTAGCPASCAHRSRATSTRSPSSQIRARRRRRTAGGQIALTVDGLPVDARIVGVLRRFPTIATGGAGFIVADEATLAAALDASLPGQGRPDELWIDTPRPGALRAALNRPPLRMLDATFRADVEHGLRVGPDRPRGARDAARGGRDRDRAGADRTARRAARRDARPGTPNASCASRASARGRSRASCGCGSCSRRHSASSAGFALAAVLTRLAVAAVSSAATLAPPRPPLVTVAPWGSLVLLALAALVAVLGRELDRHLAFGRTKARTVSAAVAAARRVLRAPDAGWRRRGAAGADARARRGRASVRARPQRGG